LVDGNVSDRRMLSHLEDGRSWPRVTRQVEMYPCELRSSPAPCQRGMGYSRSRN
jgi:hypothetical protein